MGEVFGVRAVEPAEPVSCPLGLVAHPLELAASLPDNIGIDPFQSRTQLRLVAVAAVGDPAADARVVDLGEFGQGFVAAAMQHPAANFAADARQCGRSAMRALPVLDVGDYIRPNVDPKKSSSPSGTLPVRVFSSFTAACPLWCASDAAPFQRCPFGTASRGEPRGGIPSPRARRPERRLS